MGRVLIACEFSGTARRALTDRGYDAWSCDLLPAEDRSNRHITGDVRWLSSPPPGRTLPEMWAELDEGAALFSATWNAPVPRTAVENPVMHKHAMRASGLHSLHFRGLGGVDKFSSCVMLRRRGGLISHDQAYLSAEMDWQRLNQPEQFIVRQCSKD